MFKQNKSKFAGYRLLNCETKAGDDKTPPFDKETKNDLADEILKGIDLPSDKLELIKNEPALLKLLDHTLKAKREANLEAKTTREKLEKLEKEKKAEEEEKLKKKGEYESLYNKTKEELSAKDQKIKDMLIQKETGMQAVQMGIKKASYLKLLDTSSLEVDLESGTVKNVESAMKKFKEENPDFFGEAKKIEVNNTKPKTNSEIPDDDEVKQLEKRAKASGHPRDIAAWQKAKKEAESK